MPLEFQLTQHLLGSNLETVDLICQDHMVLLNLLLWCCVGAEVTWSLLVRKDRNILVAFRITDHCLRKWG